MSGARNAEVDAHRYVRLADADEIERRRHELEAVVRAWCDARDAARDR